MSGKIFLKIAKFTIMFVIIFSSLKAGVVKAYCSDGTIQKQKLVPVYRLWSEKDKDHMVTSSLKEKDALQNSFRWNYEGIEGYIYESEQPGTIPLCRYYNAEIKNHYITSDDRFKKQAHRLGFDYEGVVGYIYKAEQPDTVPFYQFFSEVRQDYFITTDKNFLRYSKQFGGYNYKGLEGYIFKTPDGQRKPESHLSAAKVKGIKLKPVATFEGGNRYKINNIDVLDLRGNYREMGRQYGKLMKDELKDFYHLAVEKYIFKHEEMDYDEIRDIAADLFETYPQRFKEIIYGMAETSGLNINKLIILDQILAISYVSSTYNSMGCSTIATWGDYTSGNPLVFGRNFDYIDYFRKFGEYITVVVYNPNDGSVPTATIGYTGQICVMNAINKAGLFLENNEAMVSGGNTFNSNRTHFFIMELSALFNSYDITTLDAFLNSSRANCSLIINVASKNVAYSYEAPPFDIRRRSGRFPGLLVVTNHFNDPSWGILGPLHDTPDFSVRRSKNIFALAEKYKGQFNPKKMMEILDIPLKNGGATIPGYTMYQIVVLPQELKFWLKIPRFQDWTEIDLKQLFDREY